MHCNDCELCDMPLCDTCVWCVVVIRELVIEVFVVVLKVSYDLLFDEYSSFWILKFELEVSMTLSLAYQMRRFLNMLLILVIGRVLRIGYCFGILKSFITIIGNFDDLLLRESYDFVIDDFMILLLKNFMVLLLVYKFKVLQFCYCEEFSRFLDLVHEFGRFMILILILIGKVGGVMIFVVGFVF